MASDTKSQAPSQHELGQEMAGKFLGQQFYDKIVASLVSRIFPPQMMDLLRLQQDGQWLTKYLLTIAEGRHIHEY